LLDKLYSLARCAGPGAWASLNRTWPQRRTRVNATWAGPNHLPGTPCGGSRGRWPGLPPYPLCLISGGPILRNTSSVTFIRHPGPHHLCRHLHPPPALPTPCAVTFIHHPAPTCRNTVTSSPHPPPRRHLAGGFIRRPLFPPPAPSPSSTTLSSHHPCRHLHPPPALPTTCAVTYIHHQPHRPQRSHLPSPPRRRRRPYRWRHQRCGPIGSSAPYTTSVRTTCAVTVIHHLCAANLPIGASNLPLTAISSYQQPCWYGKNVANALLVAGKCS